jgi:cytochrome oxidase Cu insertion factor (SCO1/SenC/PrrC family)
MRAPGLLALFFFGAVSAAGAASPLPNGAYPLPQPGSYHLDHIFAVPRGIVIGSSYFPHLLSADTTGAITLLTFFYGLCRDPTGCPAAWSAFQAVREAARGDPLLAGKVRLVSLSFDPTHDTPTEMRLFAASVGEDARVPWLFRTTYGPAFLKPILRRFDETVAREPASADGAVVIDHVLRVYLIDPEGYVREIYSAATLDTPTILDDMRTLALERQKRVGG